jgi:hypothetical protein
MTFLFLTLCNQIFFTRLRHHHIKHLSPFYVSLRCEGHKPVFHFPVFSVLTNIYLLNNICII